MNGLLTRILMMIGGQVIIGFSIAALQIIALGTDPFNGMAIGISNTIGVSLGTYLLVVNLVLLAFVLWKKRGLIGIGTIFSTVLLGYIIDFFINFITGAVDVNFSLPVRVVLMVAAIVFLALGASIYITADLGLAPYDALGFVIEEVTNKRIPFKWARVGTDVTGVIASLVFGATIGLATFIVAFFMGPLINFFQTKILSLLQKNNNQEGNHVESLAPNVS